MKILLIGNINELKILHTFSHFTSLERMTHHSDMVLRIKDVIDDVDTLLEKDSQHLNSLKSGLEI